MDRRSLVIGGVAAAGLVSGGVSVAQQALAEGKDFKRVGKEVPSRQLPEGKKLEVAEFFWYGCPHCYAFEPSLEAWAARLAKDVHLRRVPVAFAGVHQFHQRLYFAVEKQPNFGVLHKKVFYAIHVEKKRLDTLDSVSDWAKGQGLPADQFVSELRSMGVDSAARQSKLLADAYGVDSVPSLGVNGKYLTSPSMAGNYDRAFMVVDSLLGRERG